MKIQQVLIIETADDSFRSEALGWTAEDPSLLKPGPIGFTPGFQEPYAYATVTHAMAAGWRLLAPPTQIAGYGDHFVWWLVREKE